MKMTHEESLLRKMGATLQSPDSGCCGMAGPFGFIEDKYAVSQAVGERVLLLLIVKILWRSDECINLAETLSPAAGGLGCFLFF